MACVGVFNARGTRPAYLRALIHEEGRLPPRVLAGYDRWCYGNTLLHVTARYHPDLLLDLLPHLGAYALARN